MPFRIDCREPFQQQFEKATKKHKGSRDDIKKRIGEILANSEGKVITSDDTISLKKTRLNIKKSGLGKRGGFRFVYLFEHKKEVIAPITIYHKGGGKMKKPHQVDKHIERLVDAYLSDLTGQEPSEQAELDFDEDGEKDD